MPVLRVVASDDGGTMSRRSKPKNEKRQFHWGRRVFGQEHPWVLKRGARWRGLIRAIRRVPPEPYEFKVDSWPQLVGLEPARLGSFSIGE